MEVDPLAQEERPTARLTLDLPVELVDFLERYSNYRNAMNALQERQVKKWTRKSTTEAFVAQQIRQVLAQMAEVISAHGDLPAEPAQMAAYAKRVLAALEKTPKKR